MEEYQKFMLLKRVPSPYQLDKFVLFYYGQIKTNKDTMNIYIYIYIYLLKKKIQICTDMKFYWATNNNVFSFFGGKFQ